MQVNKDQPPTESEPNSIWKRPKGDLRVFGPDGKALKDIDYSHPKHHEELGNPMFMIGLGTEKMRQEGSQEVLI